MAKRDFLKTVALVPDGLLPSRYEIDLDDVLFLYREAFSNKQDGLWNVIKWCLCYGYVMGHRATKNGTYREINQKTAHAGKNMDGFTDNYQHQPIAK